MIRKTISQFTGDANKSFEGLNIIQIGIQGPSGLKAYFNNSQDPIILGPLGIYQLELTDGSSITQIKIEVDELQTKNKSFIIDAIEETTSQSQGGNR